MSRARFELFGYLAAEAGLGWSEISRQADELAERLGCDVDWPAVHEGYHRAHDLPPSCPRCQGSGFDRE